MAGRRILPTYRFHRPTKKAIVTVYDADGQRRSILLPGAYESEESRKEYKRLPNRLNANDGKLPKQEDQKPAPLVSELIARFMDERVNGSHYRRLGSRPTDAPLEYPALCWR